MGGHVRPLHAQRSPQEAPDQLSAALPILATAAAAAPSPARLVTAAALGIAAVLVLITWVRLHPFLALTLGALALGAAAGLPLAATTASFATGFGATAAGVGALVALGAMLGRLLADSGGADVLVEAVVGRVSPAALPWRMAAVGALIGLPMFFEIGLVLLMPVILLAARRSGLPLMLVGIPALAGLSAMHALVPPHPGPLAAVAALNADLGLTLALGVAVAVPVTALAGPLFARVAARWAAHPEPPPLAPEPRGSRRPTLAATLGAVLLPVALMLGKALADILAPADAPARRAFDFVGTPLIALLVGVLAALWLLGRGAGMGRRELAASIERALPPVAGILLIVAAGGGFKQALVDSGVGTLVAGWVEHGGLPLLPLAWAIAVAIRLATGSATVATVTASGLLGPLAATLPPAHASLLVLAIGSGSVFLSHVNDAGFWLVKEYFGLSVGETFRTWSAMETVISVGGLALVLAVSAFL